MTSPYIPDRGDLIWISFDPQSGHEQAGRRPGLVLSPKSYNAVSQLAIICPITNRIKGYPFEVVLPTGGAITGAVLADHVKNLDWQVRRAVFADTAPISVMDEVIQKIELLLR